MPLVESHSDKGLIGDIRQSIKTVEATQGAFLSYGDLLLPDVVVTTWVDTIESGKQLNHELLIVKSVRAPRFLSCGPSNGSIRPLTYLTGTGKGRHNKRHPRRPSNHLLACLCNLLTCLPTAISQRTTPLSRTAEQQKEQRSLFF